MKILLYATLILSALTGFALGAQKDKPSVQPPVKRIVLPDTFFEPLTHMVIQAYLGSVSHVNDKYWWLDCPGLAIKGDGILRREEIKATQDCMKAETHRDYARELKGAFKLGGYHYGKPLWNKLETALNQYDNLEHLFTSTKKYYWQCEVVEIEANGLISDFKGKRTFIHTPIDPVKPGELHDCVFPFYPRSPIYQKLTIIKNFGETIGMKNITQPPLSEWTVRIFSSDLSSPMTLIDSSVTLDKKPFN